MADITVEDDNCIKIPSDALKDFYHMANPDQVIEALVKYGVFDEAEKEAIMTKGSILDPGEKIWSMVPKVVKFSDFPFFMSAICTHGYNRSLYPIMKTFFEIKADSLDVAWNGWFTKNLDNLCNEWKELPEYGLEYVVQECSSSKTFDFEFMNRAEIDALGSTENGIRAKKMFGKLLSKENDNNNASLRHLLSLLKCHENKFQLKKQLLQVVGRFLDSIRDPQLNVSRWIISYMHNLSENMGDISKVLFYLEYKNAVPRDLREEIDSVPTTYNKNMKFLNDILRKTNCIIVYLIAAEEYAGPNFLGTEAAKHAASFPMDGAEGQILKTWLADNLEEVVKATFDSKYVLKTLVRDNTLSIEDEVEIERHVQQQLQRHFLNTLLKHKTPFHGVVAILLYLNWEGNVVGGGTWLNQNEKLIRSLQDFSSQFFIGERDYQNQFELWIETNRMELIQHSSHPLRIIQMMGLLGYVPEEEAINLTNECKKCLVDQLRLVIEKKHIEHLPGFIAALNVNGYSELYSLGDKLSNYSKTRFQGIPLNDIVNTWNPSVDWDLIFKYRTAIRSMVNEELRQKEVNVNNVELVHRMQSLETRFENLEKLLTKLVVNLDTLQK